MKALWWKLVARLVYYILMLYGCVLNTKMCVQCFQKADHRIKVCELEIAQAMVMNH